MLDGAPRPLTINGTAVRATPGTVVRLPARRTARPRRHPRADPLLLVMLREAFPEPPERPLDLRPPFPYLRGTEPRGLRVAASTTPGRRRV
ncbi:MAG: hypothetical protein IPJ61_21055 [Tessaracoccus sp.]|uniref:hypothetical protein n=1 Tax=Tessaracoccus sp. TaxID=1971211 RepID=UPI001ECA227B|nr:hypothetical protein [Tessaracoccus sp.]MBK7823479.1 hypothetical protein [Tessaracoccus sp.]